MVRKIGKCILVSCMWLLWCSAATADVNVELRILDDRGVPVAKTGVGVPLTMEILVRGTSARIEALEIAGLDGFTVEKRGITKQVNTINGVITTTVAHQYTLLPSKEANYTIGPVRIRLDNKEYLSGTVYIIVEKNYRSAAVQVPIGLELSVEEEYVFVGESVPVRIRWYGPQEYELVAIEPLQEQPTFKGSQVRGPITGFDVYQGKKERYIEWTTAIVPLKKGELMIPAIQAQYKEPLPKNRQYDFFGGLLGLGHSLKNIYSNALVLNVADLPPYTGNVNAIGSFSAYSLHCNQVEAKQGEGIVATIELTGNGDLEGIQHPPLQLPEGLTYYDSKATIIGSKKIFEYIIQGTQVGTWPIKEQEFVFFDTAAHAYKKLTTESCVLTIKPGHHAPVADSITNVPTTQDVQQIEEKNQQFPLCEGLPFQQMPHNTRHFYMFWVYAILCVLCCVYALVPLYRWYMNSMSIVHRRKRAYARAQKELKRAQKTCATAALYDIFVHFIAAYKNIASADVTVDQLPQEHTQFPAAIVVEWNNFYAAITEQAYSGRKLGKEEQEYLFEQARKWLSLWHKGTY